MTAPALTCDPLRRFVEFAEALEQRRRWWQGATFLRYAALALTTASGSAHRITDDVIETAERIRRRSGWFGNLNSDVRFLVAAMLVRHGEGADRFHDEMERGRALFRAAGLRRGSIHEAMALLLLWLGRDRQPFREPDVRRFRDILAGMRQHHPWITGPNDYPSCALLTLRDEPVHRQMRRIERFYQRLRENGMTIGDSLQMVSHLLYFNPAPDDVVVRRFVALRARFKAQGVAMWQSDNDELALLTLADCPAHLVVDTVLRHRERLRRLRPQPDASLSFSLASVTGFLELVGTSGDRTTLGAQSLAQLHQVLAAQVTAIAACGAAATIAATGGSH